MITWEKLQGLIEYQDAIELMERHLSAVLSGAEHDTIMLLEHKDVYTSGTGANPAELLNAGGIPVIATGRGGKYTYHGPGQRIIYPIIDLRLREKDLKLYIRQLESWIISTLRAFDVEAYTIVGKVGIWVWDHGIESKIAAIGVRVRKWVTYHGVAVNISPDLDKFRGIIPCGISDAPVTSLRKLGIEVTMDKFDIELKKQFPFAN